jgi:hypothetical protein
MRAFEEREAKLAVVSVIGIVGAPILVIGYLAVMFDPAANTAPSQD